MLFNLHVMTQNNNVQKSKELCLKKKLSKNNTDCFKHFEITRYKDRKFFFITFEQAGIIGIELPRQSALWCGTSMGTVQSFLYSRFLSWDHAGAQEVLLLIVGNVVCSDFTTTCSTETKPTKQTNLFLSSHCTQRVNYIHK